MFIAVSNAHGWGKDETERGALDMARANSVYRGPDLLVRVWDCEKDAYCDSHGAPIGILSAPEGREFKRVFNRWAAIDAA